jgi:hypothetical protein
VGDRPPLSAQRPSLGGVELGLACRGRSIRGRDIRPLASGVQTETQVAERLRAKKGGEGMKLKTNVKAGGITYTGAG